MNPYDTTIYRVQVTDVCGYVDTTSVEIFVNQYDSLLVSADTTGEDTLAQICVLKVEKVIILIYGQMKLQLNVLMYYSADPYIAQLPMVVVLKFSQWIRL